MSDFSAINTALTGLLAQQEALDTTAHNVSNATTPGYTRQRVNLVALGGNVQPGMWSGSSNLGRGVGIEGIQRLGDLFLEARSIADHAASSDLTLAQQVLSRVQDGFAEPGPNGLSSALADFWSSWDDVANNPTDLATRDALIGKAQTAAGAFNQAVSSIRSVWESSLTQVQDSVGQLNATASSIAQLNDRIRISQSSGGSPNDLIDQRNQLVDKLAQFAGATTQAHADGTVDVYIGSNAIVRGNLATTVSVGQSSSGVQLQWNMGNPPPPVAVGSGQLHALLTALNVTLPGYLGSLSTIASTLAQAVNTQQGKGFTLATPTTSSQSGPPMLVATQQAGTVSPAEPASPQLAVAAGFTGDLVAAAGTAGAPGDGSNAQAIAELGSNPTGADVLYRSFINAVGTDVQRASSQLSIQKAVTSQSDAALQGQEGVSTDEEMANMVSFQHAYAAAARMLTTIDSTLDTLINHTGLTT